MFRRTSTATASCLTSVALVGMFAMSGCASPTPQDAEVEATTAMLYQMWDPWPANASGDTLVPVCLDISASSHPNFAKALPIIRYSLGMSWERFARIKFTGWNNCSANSNNMVRLKDHPAGGGWSSGNGIVNPVVEIDLDDSDMRYLSIHEFGHVIGFEHEHQRPEAWNYDASGNPTTHKYCPNIVDVTDGNLYPKPGGVELTDYDVYSVMSYCPSATYHLTYRDILGVQSVYDKNPTSNVIEGFASMALPLL